MGRRGAGRVAIGRSRRAPGQAGDAPATTIGSAELLGMQDELGSIEPGKRADLVLVTGDPFDLATLGERIESVWKDGSVVAGASPA